jgi:ATP-binding cassette subfamily B protein/subfamily B ATP-binding cassette protein MsbA
MALVLRTHRSGAMRDLIRALKFFRTDVVRIVGVLLLMLTSIGLNVLKPWPMALIVDCVLAQKAFPGWLPAAWTEQSQPRQLVALIILLLLLHLSHAGVSATQNYMAISVGLRGLQRVRNEVFGWLQRLSLRFHHGTEAGDIIFRAGTDTCAFQALLQQGVFIMVSALFTLLFMTVVMMRINLQLTLLALAAVPFLVVTIRTFSHEMRNRGVAAAQAESKVYSLIHQGITALPLTQSYTREEQEQNRFVVETRRAKRHKMSQHGLEVFYWLTISVLLVLDTALLTWFGAKQVLDGHLTLGELLVFLAYLGQMFDPLNQLSGVGATLSSAGASVRRVFEILDTPDEVKDLPGARPVASRQPRPVRSHSCALAVSGNITYDGVCFAYDGSRMVLNQVDFSLRAGQSAAIIGPSGAGKSTLLNLLPRFFDPAKGAVLLEGVDLRQLRVKELRTQIALVLQEPIILPATVADNISYGKSHASMDEIESAARAANAHHFICKLPNQYQTAVGEGGTRLSVGERQRINLARAFLKDAPILLMDEPTSALDVESEAQVVDSLTRLMRGRTTLMVAHRLTTIQRVSCILVLDNGTLKESGAPEELLGRDGYYSRVVTGQMQLG